MLGDDPGTDEMRRTRMAHELMLSRIRARVVRYLSREERVLGLSDDANAMFDEFRAETDVRLGRVCSDGLVKFAAACRAFMQHQPESANHALTSCRRLVKAVADALYPASEEPVVGADGTVHDMRDEEYINRLVQWVYENHPKGKERGIVVDALRDLHARLIKLNDLASKGVHDEVEGEDIRFCLIQTYLTVGEVLRFSALHDDGE